VSDVDTDGDGTPDCNDGCPDDPNKIDPGQCGCGVSDVDTDGDGTPDCNDGCPDDPNKTEPGQCGCGVSDVDTDGDGVPDCVDNCIDTPNPDQADADGDGIGDACDTCTDTDGDGFGNPGYPANECEVDNCPDVYNPDQADYDGDGIGDLCDPCTTRPTLSLAGGEGCYAAGEIVTVTIEMTGLCDDQEVRGGQYFLAYDHSLLEFVSAAPSHPFPLEVYEDVPGSDGPGTIDYSTGVDFGDPATTEDGTVAILEFKVLGDACDVGGLVRFRENSPPTRLSDGIGLEVTVDTNDLGPIRLDVSAPTLTCPTDVTVYNIPGTCRGTPTWDDATAVDNCDDSPVVTQTGGPASGDTLAVGSYVVEYSATDECGNTSTCTFNVTVADNEDPSIGCPENITVNADAGCDEAYVTVPPAEVGDNCAVDTVVNDYNGTNNASDTYPVGTTTVKWTVTDIYGNTNTCEHTVTVTSDNELLVDVELDAPVTGTRCITFRLWDCDADTPVEIESEVEFANGLATGVLLIVPCGNYVCITAKDELHTLQRTAESVRCSVCSSSLAVMQT
jgi:hypothetical protein